MFAQLLLVILAVEDLVLGAAARDLAAERRDPALDGLGDPRILVQGLAQRLLHLGQGEAVVAHLAARRLDRLEGDVGEVLFHARIFERGKDRSFVELSTFRREGGLWKYESGVLLPASKLGAPPMPMKRDAFRELAEASR